MITPINSYQSNTNFCASLKSPNLKKCRQKISPILNEKQAKISNCFGKLKEEFKNLDEESKWLLYKSIILLSALTIVFAQIGHFIKLVMDKIHYFVE